jgi:hypothetical protein
LHALGWARNLNVRVVTDSQAWPRTSPVLAGIPGLVLPLPDARVLATVAGIAVEFALQKDLLILG